LHEAHARDRSALTAPKVIDRRVVGVGVLCYVLWGVAPILFIALGRLGASPWEIVGQRTVWSAPCALACVLLAGQSGDLRRILARPRIVGLLALSAAAIATGWALFVWAVNHGRNLEASLGYYINPLMNMAAGALLFRERIGRLGWAAIALAATGVALQTWALGHPPVVALILATTFWIYGLVRRQVDADALPGLALECLLMMGPGLIFLLWLRGHAPPRFGGAPLITSLMLLLGPVTVAPLALFSWTARRLPFSAMAFIQFISPTIGFATGLALGEPLSPLSALSFVFIWAGAAVFAIGGWRAARRLQSAA